MAISYVGAGTVAAGTGAITVGFPAGRQTGDLLLMVIETANEAVTTPGDWLDVPSSPQGVGTAAGTAATRLNIMYRWNDGTTIVNTVSDPGNHAVARMVAYRGVDPANPFNASAGSVKSTASKTATFPGVTTTKDNCVVLLAEAHALPDSTSTAIAGTRSGSNLTSLTERLDNNTNAGNGGGFSLADGLKATAGSVTGGTVALTTSSVTAHITLALQPFVELQQLTLVADPAAVDVVTHDAGVSRTLPPLSAEPAAFALAGELAALFKGVTLTTEAGAFTASDGDATLRAARSLKGNQVTFATTGQVASQIPTRRMAGDTGAFAADGVAAGLVKGYRLTADPASYAYVGSGAGLGKGFKLAADAGALSAAGQEAEWVLDLSEPPQMPEVNGAELLWHEILGEPIRDRFADAEPGAFDLAGQDAKVLYGRAVSAPVAGALTTAGQASAFRRTYSLKADVAAFTEVGQSASLRTARRLLADQAAFAHGGQPAGVLHGRVVSAATSGLSLQPSDVGFLWQHVIRPVPAALSLSLQDVEILLDLDEPPQMPEVNGAELLWYELLGEPIPARTIETESGQFDHAGQDAKVLYGRTVPVPAAGVFTAAGQASAFRRTYNLKADVASFAEVGLAANLRTARRLVSDPSAFTHAGAPAGVLHGRVVGATPASFALAGVAMNFKFQRFLRPILINLAATGEAAALLRSLMFRADGSAAALNRYSEAWEPGYTTATAKLLRQFKTTAVPAAFSSAVFDATFRKTKLFIAAGGSFSLAGQAASTRTARRLTAATAGLSLQPYDIGFSWQHVMRPVPQAFSLAGVDAALKKVIFFRADPGAFAVQGYSSRPFFSSLPQAKDYVVRPLELRETLRPTEMRQTVRPQEMTAAARPQELRGALRPADDRTSERGEEPRYAEHE